MIGFPNRCTRVLVMVNAHALALQIKGCNSEHDVSSCRSKPHCKLFGLVSLVSLDDYASFFNTIRVTC